MILVPATTREDTIKVLEGLTWISTFWNDTMMAISFEGSMPIKDFNEMKDAGAQFLEKFVLPVCNAYDIKLAELPVPTPSEVVPEPQPAQIPNVPTEPAQEASQPRRDLPRPQEHVGGLSPLEPSTVGETNSFSISNMVSGEDVTVPAEVFETLVKASQDLAKAQTEEVLATINSAPSKKVFTKKYTGFKSGSLTIEQRDLIAAEWIRWGGDTDPSIYVTLATSLGIKSSNSIQGWVRYLSKVAANKTYTEKEKGWKFLISSGKISDRPVPDFFLTWTPTPFTSKSTVTKV